VKWNHVNLSADTDALPMALVEVLAILLGLSILETSRLEATAYGRDRKFEVEPNSGPSECFPGWPTAAVGVLRERAVPAIMCSSQL
jgi:hypothetical protein